MKLAGKTLPAKKASRSGRGRGGSPLFIARALNALAIALAPSPSVDIEELLARVGKTQKVLG